MTTETTNEKGVRQLADFKVGDRVRIITPYVNSTHNPGMIGEVCAVGHLPSGANFDSDYVWVCANGVPYPYCPQEIEPSDVQTALANARLIAAAPELLDEICKLYEELVTLTGGDPSHPLANTVGHWRARINSVVAKVKGGAA